MKKEIKIVFDYIEETDEPSWEDFHEKNPTVSRVDYEQGNKEFQEM